MNTTPENDSDTGGEGVETGGHPIPDLETNMSMEGVPAHHHIAEEDTDEEITEKLRRQGVLIGPGAIAPRVFWPALVLVVGVVLVAVGAPTGTHTGAGEPTWPAISGQSTRTRPGRPLA